MKYNTQYIQTKLKFTNQGMLKYVYTNGPVWPMQSPGTLSRNHHSEKQNN